MTNTQARQSQDRPVCWRLPDWPEVDRALWLDAIAPTDPFAEFGGTRARHRPLSNRNIVRGYGRWLCYLASIGALIPGLHPTERITREAVVAYIAELESCGNRKGTIIGRLEELREAAKVMGPGHDWSFIGDLAARVRARKDQAAKKPSLLVTSEQLVELGFDLMERASSYGNTGRAAVLFRDGLLIALLALRPLRRRNLSELTIGVDLICTGTDWAIAIPPEASKTNVALESEWPAVLREPLEHYLAVYRPLLMARDGRWHREIGQRLWVSADGSPLTQDAVHGRVTAHTLKHFGVAINPHKFRHVAATTLALQDPKNVRAAGPLLGHRSFQMTDQYYVQATGLEAHRSFLSHLSALRRESRSPR